MGSINTTSRHATHAVGIQAPPGTHGLLRHAPDKLGVASHICFEPQIVGALGAALFARAFLDRQGPNGR